MISIVIPLYNKEKSINKTLQSVIEQTFSDWECIIVNDGSTDNSAVVCEEFINSFTSTHTRSIRLFSKPNGGVSSARNYGIEKSHGEYVAFLDGDDVWEPDYLVALNQLIKDYPNAVLYGLGYGWIKGGERISRAGENFRGIVPNDGTWLMRFWTTTCCAPKAMIQKVGLFNDQLTHGEDLDMWWRLMLKGEVVFDNMREYAYYVQDAENRAMHRVPPIDKHVVSIIDQYETARVSNAAFRKAFDTQMIYFLYQYMFTPYMKTARKISAKLDFPQLKFSLRFRMQCPHIYRLLTGR